ncbi:hypothetical protein WYH_01273 [Croceibacterium atlanticum]|uniref:Uncharacterized protein n=2 Tax=Croceibacterium atlanticum TaxID=1267766 RepID=A0A0F7KP66_9SPHN|nr:hypothetical protein [Croceibacterium atlanticum]AKH42318.1 hypothetical protein WYH_01273 [Croceibacterium atlanticum]
MAEFEVAIRDGSERAIRSILGYVEAVNGAQAERLHEIVGTEKS